MYPAGAPPAGADHSSTMLVIVTELNVIAPTAAGDVDCANAALRSLSRAALVASTSNLYSVPPVRPVASHVVDNASTPPHDTTLSIAPLAPSSMYTVYPVTAAPLVTTGADQDSEMLLVV